ncbi:SDR family oxidoreductase [Paracoccus shanxieyensis]|uniref:SDR family NAD(P)-dependent oxidoreductase n=1 Tax=Paracoccus shanxieyensis TaxID=2675752 RepID=A0A6L6IUC4_9RHOB|nr:SDR family oxidoreductase [Paracoccus shanxieyensis]MTH64135.1 SDR family NAD(P)-dependent oxidoreductase [Paracoccus shanxieyensis]MTH87279.1 SDR family NAD(P)-dependent oxidoreductase [Paracoccus shanxieyensis]
MTQALITGATSGIGKAITLAMKAAGHDVIAVGRQPDALAALEAQGIRAMQLDLADPAAIDQLAGLTPDVLINNAGMMPAMLPFAQMDMAQIDRAIDLNLRSALAVTRAVVPGMQDRGRGHVFFTGSTAGHAPFAKLAVYCATKAAIGGFAQALRLDLAPYGVRVTEIVAGRVETGLYKDLLSAEARAAMYAGNSAVQPEDVAAMVLAVLTLPQSVDVARFDILPMHQATATGAQNGAQDKGK